MKSRRLKAVWEEKRQTVREEKLTGQCPAWLALNADRKSFRVIEPRAAIVRRIYEMSISGIGHQSIAKILNSEGIPSWGDHGKRLLAGDIQDLAQLADELRTNNNALSVYLRGRFDETTRQLLGEFNPELDYGYS